MFVCNCLKLRCSQRSPPFAAREQEPKSLRSASAASVLIVAVGDSETCPSYRHHEAFRLRELLLIPVEGQEVRCLQL